MKSILEFLVNNRINKVDPNETKEISKEDIVKDMCFAEEYEFEGKLNTTLCVANKVFANCITVFIAVYLYENEPGVTHTVYIDDAIYEMESNHKRYRTTTVEETELLNTIMKKAYDEFKGNGNIEIGKVKDMKFRKRNRL